MNLDIGKTHRRTDPTEPIVLRQGEKGQTLTFALYDGESTYTPPSGATVTLKVKHADGNYAAKAATWSGNSVSVVTDTTVTASHGRCKRAYIEVKNSSDTVIATTEDFPLVILPAADISGQQSGHYVPVIDKIIGDISSMTAAATTLAAGSSATAQLDKAASPWVMRFGIPKGDKGAKGDKGEKGDPGNIPAGGTAGQVLKKKSSTNYDMEWGEGGGGGDIPVTAIYANTVVEPIDSKVMIYDYSLLYKYGNKIIAGILELHFMDGYKIPAGYKSLLNVLVDVNAVITEGTNFTYDGSLFNIYHTTSSNQIWTHFMEDSPFSTINIPIVLFLE